MAAGRLVVPPWFPARNRSGVPVPGALLAVYVNETAATKAAIYANESLTTPLANPVEANSSGVFPDIWAEAGTAETPTLYRVSISGPDGESILNPAAFDNWQPSLDSGTAQTAIAEAASIAAQAYYEDILALEGEADSSIAIATRAAKTANGSDFADKEEVTQNLLVLHNAVGASSVGLRTYLRKLPVPPEAFGWNAGDTADNTAAFAKLKTAAEAGWPILINGHYYTAVSMRFETPVRLIGTPGSRIERTAGTGPVIELDYTDGGGFFDHGGYIDNLILDGAGFADDGLSLKGVVSGQFANIRVTNVTQAGLHLHWAQLCYFPDFICSNNIELFTTTPLYGILADTASSSANTFPHPCLEGVGDGIYGDGFVNCVFINGTSEGNTGAGIKWLAGSIGNSVDGMDLEVNGGGDIDIDGGDANDFVNLKAGFGTPFPSIRVRSGSIRNSFRGGSAGDIDVDAGAVGTSFRDVSLFGAGATITDAGDLTDWEGLYNIIDGVRIPDSAKAFVVSADVAAAGTYNTNAKLNRLNVVNALGASLTIANPTNPTDGATVTYRITNYSGGALTVTWGAAFVATGWVSPPSGVGRTVQFTFDSNFNVWNLSGLSPLAVGVAVADVAASTVAGVNAVGDPPTGAEFNALVAQVNTLVANLNTEIASHNATKARLRAAGIIAA